MGAADAKDRLAVIYGVGATVIFIYTTAHTVLFYATGILQTRYYNKVYAKSYIISCLTKLGWLLDSRDPTLCVPLTPAPIKLIGKSIGPLDPSEQIALSDKHGFKYRTINGMLIFAIQIGRVDIAPAVYILCKFNDHPADAHYLASKNVMRYLPTTSDKGLMYWRSTASPARASPSVILSLSEPSSFSTRSTPRITPSWSVAAFSVSAIRA
jgi:hypothetical protein